MSDIPKAKVSEPFYQVSHLNGGRRKGAGTEPRMLRATVVRNHAKQPAGRKEIEKKTANVLYNIKKTIFAPETKSESRLRGHDRALESMSN